MKIKYNKQEVHFIWKKYKKNNRIFRMYGLRYVQNIV